MKMRSMNYKKVLTVFTPIVALLLMAVAGCGGRSSGGIANSSLSSGRVTGYLYTQVSSRSAEATPSGYLPLAGASVDCAGVTGTTNTAGFYDLANVPAGMQDCTATKSGFGTVEFSVNVTPGQNNVATPEGATDYAIAPTATGTLVVDTTPDGATISVDGAQAAVTTDATLTLAPGSYSVSVSLTGYDEVTAQTATVTAGQSSTATFTLTPSLTAISITAAGSATETISFSESEIGDTAQLGATCTYYDQSTEDCTSSVTWTIADVTGSSVATVSAFGLVTSANSGSATVTATKGSITDTATVMVADTLQSITLSPTSISDLPVGSTSGLTATCAYAISDATTCPTLTWTSNDTSVATVADGTVTGVAAGTTSVKASSGSIESSAVSVEVVVDEITAISVTPTSVSELETGSTSNLSASCTWSVSSTTSCGTLTWNSSSESVATVSASGVVTAVAAGSTNITAATGSVTSNSVAVTVVNAEPTCDGVSTFCVDIVGADATAGNTVDLVVTMANPPTAGIGSGVMKITWSDSDLTYSSVAHGSGVTALAETTTTAGQYSVSFTSNPVLTSGQTLVTLTLTVDSSATGQLAVEFDTTLQGLNFTDDNVQRYSLDDQNLTAKNGYVNVQ